MANSQINQLTPEQLKALYMAPQAQFDPSKVTQALATGTTLQDTIASKSLERQKAEQDLKKEIFTVTELQNKKAEEDKAASLLKPITPATPVSTMMPKANVGNIANVNPEPTQINPVQPGQEGPVGPMENQVMQTPDQIQSQMEAGRKEELKGLALKLNPSAIAPTLFGVAKGTPMVAVNKLTGAIRQINPADPNSMVLQPGEEFKESAIAEARYSGLIAQRGEQFMERQWNSLGKAVNALDKGSRTSVGMAAVGNQRAARALQVLKDHDNPTLLEFINSDLNGIMQGGAPHVEMMNRTSPQSMLAVKWASLKQNLLSNPQLIEVPEWRQQMGDVIKGIMDVDNEVIDINTGIASESFKKAIQSDPERFQRMVGHLENVKTVGMSPGNGGTPTSPRNAGKPDMGAILRQMLPKKK